MLHQGIKKFSFIFYRQRLRLTIFSLESRLWYIVSKGERSCFYEKQDEQGDCNH